MSISWRWCLALVATAALASSLTAYLGRSQTTSNVIEGAVAASVQLFAEREGGARRAGSGVVVAVEADGTSLILTAAHLVEPLVEQRVVAADPNGADPIEAEILYLDAESDTAVLRARGLGGAAARLGPAARLGDGVWVVSYPWGRKRTLVSGVISQVDARLQGIVGPVRLIDAAVSYGTSGGGVFDRRTGSLLGIVRGYRTAKLVLPGADKGQGLDVPIAGETTVIPTSSLLCVLRRAGLANRLASPGRALRPSSDNCQES